MQTFLYRYLLFLDRHDTRLGFILSLLKYFVSDPFLLHNWQYAWCPGDLKKSTFFWSIHSLLSLNSKRKILNFERKIVKACNISFSKITTNITINIHQFALWFHIFQCAVLKNWQRRKQGLHNSNIVSLSNAALERIYFTQPSSLLLLKLMNLWVLLKLTTIKLLSAEIRILWIMTYGIYQSNKLEGQHLRLKEEWKPNLLQH